jgi:hypothetical protein
MVIRVRQEVVSGHKKNSTKLQPKDDQNANMVISVRQEVVSGYKKIARNSKLKMITMGTRSLV